MGRRSVTPADEKIKKIFFSNFKFFVIDALEGCYICSKIMFLTKIYYFFSGFMTFQGDYLFSHFTHFLIKQKKKYNI